MSPLDREGRDEPMEGQGKGLVIWAMIVAVLSLVLGGSGLLYGMKANKAQTAAFAVFDSTLTAKVAVATSTMTAQTAELQASTKTQLATGLAAADSVAKASSIEATEIARSAERAASDAVATVELKLAEAAATNTSALDAMRTDLANHKKQDEEDERLATEAARDLIKTTVGPEVQTALAPFTARQDSIEHLIRKDTAIDGVVKCLGVGLGAIGIWTGSSWDK